MFILDLPDLRDPCEKLCFVNPSGLVELWVTKSRISRYKKPDRVLRYLRRKLGDETIHKIIPYETDSYSIIRHPLQDVNKFIKEIHKRFKISKCAFDFAKFTRKHIELFNHLNFVIKFCYEYPSMYHLVPIRFKSNIKLLDTVLESDQAQFKNIPYVMKNNRDLVIYLIKQTQRKWDVTLIYRHLSYELRKDPEILSVTLIHSIKVYDDGFKHNIVDHIPDNLINNRNFILSLNINTPSALYRFLDRNMQQDYDIILKFGYFDDRDEYNNIMTPDMKLDIELHKKLISNNAHIFRYMTDKLRDNIELAYIFIDNIDTMSNNRIFVEKYLSARLLNDPNIESKLSKFIW